MSRRWVSLEAHHRVVLRASEGARAPADDVADADGWVDLEEHVRHVSWDDVPRRVLALIVRQAWAWMPDHTAIAVAARSGSWPDLERQRRTPTTLHVLGLGGGALAGIGAIARVDPGTWDAGVPWSFLGPQAVAALAGAFRVRNQHRRVHPHLQNGFELYSEGALHAVPVGFALQPVDLGVLRAPRRARQFGQVGSHRVHWRSFSRSSTGS